MAGLESQMVLIVADFGGVQKEAFFYRVPCVALRDETGWVELGWNRLAFPSMGDGLAGCILQTRFRRRRSVSMWRRPFGALHRRIRIGV